MNFKQNCGGPWKVVHGVVHGRGPRGGPWKGSKGWSMDRGLVFSTLPCLHVMCQLKKKHNARKAVWFTKAKVHWSNFCIFVDSIDSQIILRKIRESKMDSGNAVNNCQ